MRIKTVWSLLACTVLLFCAANVAARSEAADTGFYTAKDKEFYLAPEPGDS